MSVQNKPDYKIFADGAKPGEVVDFPDVLRGWGVTLDTTGGIPPMEFFNSFGKRLNEWLMYLTQRGIPEWDSSVDYPSGATVIIGNTIYKAIKANKGENPPSSQSTWDTLTKNLGVDGKINAELTKIPGGSDVLTYFPGKPTGFYSSGADMNNTPEPSAWRNFIWLNHGGDRYGQLICLWGGGKIATRSLNAASWDIKWNISLSNDDITESLGQSSSKVLSQKKVTEELQAQSLLTKIKTVDGANSGLDADLLRGLPADFESYLTPNGRQKLPSGLIIQWGNKTISPDSIETINFPAAFPRRVFVVIGNPHSANYSQSTATVNQVSYAKTGFSVKNNSQTNQVDFHYISLGE